MTLKLYNTLSHTKETFTPQDPGHVGLYACGPTVYDFAHIGNARPVVVIDVLTRLLRRLYPRVTYVRNITDVDDKINAAARERGEPIAAITKRTTQAYHEDMASLGALSPDIEPRATEHIPEMITMIQDLIAKGHAYAADGHVLFSVSSYKDYGHLSRRNQDELLAGARIEVAPYKKDAGDFVLWKPSDDQTPGWDSPWGRGRPGWHIECSAMASKYLGNTFDIHGGGLDLTFPHHENEVAQSCCANDTPYFAKYWVHNGLLTVDGEKMSKSLGNFYTVRDLLAEFPGEALRYMMLTSHYRQPLDLTKDLIRQSQHILDRFYGALKQCDQLTSVEPDEAVLHALLDDMNVPLALARIHELVGQVYKTEDMREKNRLGSLIRSSAQLLGVLQGDPEAWFKQLQGDLTSDAIEGLIDQRTQARANKDFAESDRIRQLLLDQGVVLEDSATGTTWRRA